MGSGRPTPAAAAVCSSAGDDDDDGDGPIRRAMFSVAQLRARRLFIVRAVAGYDEEYYAARRFLRARAFVGKVHGMCAGKFCSAERCCFFRCFFARECIVGMRCFNGVSDGESVVTSGHRLGWDFGHCFLVPNDEANHL